MTLTRRGLAAYAFRSAHWDPIYPLAADFKQTFLDPARKTILDALATLGELSGQEILPEDDWALEAFLLCLAEIATDGSGLPAERRGKFLQVLAGHLYAAHRDRTSVRPAFFWSFVGDLTERYLDPASPKGKKGGLAKALDRFLEHFGLGGAENFDVIAGIHGKLVPIFKEARTFAQSTRHRDLAGSLAR